MPKKRTSLNDTLAQAARAKAGATAGGTPASGRGARGAIMTTAISLPRETWLLLRRVTFKRAEETGGRPSVSGLLMSLVEAHRAEFEAELKR
jgi:hypothetical protein